MRIICLGLILIFVSTINCHANFDSISLHITRIKKEALEDGSACLLQCIGTMEEQLEAIKSVRTQQTQFQQSSSTRMCQRYEPDQLEALCGSHKKANQCLDSCPEGEMRNVGVNALTPLNFMCVDRLEDFKKHLPCLDSNCELIEKSCQPVCRQYTTSVDKLTELQRDMNVRQSYGVPAVTKMVSDACEFIDCFNTCSHPLIVSKCGTDAADLQRDTVKKAFASITTLLSNVGAPENALPNSCQSLALPSEETESDYEEEFSNKNFTSSNPSPKHSGKAMVEKVHGGTTETNMVLENEAMFSSCDKTKLSMTCISVVGIIFLTLSRLL